MSEEYRQRLSELQDGELAEAQVPDLLDAIAADPALRACWERYALISQALRAEAIDPDTRILADRVRAALQSEPALTEPARLYHLPQRLRPRLMTLALAASLVLVAIMAVLPVLQGPSRLGALAPVAARLPDSKLPASRRWQMERREFASKLDRYLVTHQAAAPATAAQGFLPYAVLVSDNAGR